MHSEDSRSNHTQCGNVANDSQEVIHGFKLVKSKEFPQYNFIARMYVHEKHGCQFLNIETKDNNNTFAITVKTLCFDDSGSTHVLEHMVLHGSEKYPINDVFNELEKRSIASYMNASTYFDWTQYPFTTQNEKDFHNILDVYMDAVYHPQLSENNFLVECHHLEPSDLNDPNSQLTHCGVVYNEMAGVLSSESEYYSEKLRAALLSDTPYRFIFGGEPSSIAKMTLDDLKSQHKKYYAPSNSLFFHYGSFDKVKIFEHVNSFLSKIEPVHVEFPIENLIQPKWSEPKRIEIEGPMGTMGDDSKKIKSTIQWLIGDCSEDQLYYDLYVIDALLTGSCAASLYQKLIKSQIAVAFLETGPDSSMKNLTFQIGVEGLTEDNLELFHDTVMETLQEIVKNGFSKELIASALHSIEITERRISGNFGKRLLNSMTSEWVMGLDPFKVMDVTKYLEDLRERIESNENYLENIVDKYLLNNKSRIHFVMRPVKNFIEDRNKKVQNELNDLQNTLSDEEKLKIVETAKKLKKHVEEPKPLHLLPSVKPKDIERSLIPLTMSKENGIWVFEVPTNGIVYGRIRCEVNLNDLLIRDTRIFANCFAAIGCGDLDDEQFSIQEDLYTGGLVPSVVVDTDTTSKEDNPKLYVILSFSCLERNIEKTLSLLRSVLFEPYLENKEQIIALTNMLASEYTDDIMDSGSTFASICSQSKLRRSSAIEEIIEGVTFLKRITSLTEYEDNHDEIVQIVSDFYHNVFRKGKFDASLNCEKKNAEILKPKIFELLQELNKGTDMESLQSESRYDLIDEFIDQQNEFANNFIEIDTSTNFTSVSKIAPLFNEDLSIATTVLAKLLEGEIFYQDVRLKLNSYGAIASYNSVKGTFTLSSYRDSNCQGVIKAAHDCLVKVKNGEFTDEMVDRAIVQLFTALDKPVSPSIRGYYLFMGNYNQEDKAKRRLKYLDVKKDDLIEAAKYLLEMEERITVLGNISVSQPPDDFLIEKLADNDESTTEN